jgi:hypothetical protein
LARERFRKSLLCDKLSAMIIPHLNTNSEGFRFPASGSGNAAAF